MTPNKEDSGRSARMKWALLTPVILVFAVFTGIGMFFLPVLCIYFDRRSNTYTGAAMAAVALTAFSLLWGSVAASVCAFIALTTATAYVLERSGVPFKTGFLGSVVGGVLGGVVMLGILGSTLGQPVNEAAARWLAGHIATLKIPGPFQALDIFAAQFQALQQPDATGYSILMTVPPEILKLPVQDKVDIVRLAFEQIFVAYIPAWAFAAGMVTGGLGYYLPALALDKLQARQAGAERGIAVQPFAAFRTPKYIVISIIVLLLVSNFGLASGNEAFVVIETAANEVLSVLMTFQALALLSFFLNRKRVGGWVQVLILVPTAAIFSCLLYWLGLFDVLFDVRSISMRVELIRAKGKQVFTQDGLEELRKMEQKKKQDKKNGKDGEDGKL